MNVFEALTSNDAFKEAVKPVDQDIPEHSCLHCASLGTCEDAKGLAGMCEHFEPLVLRGDGEILTVPAEPLSFPCQGCESHHMGWCRAVPGKPFFNIQFLAACPLEGCQ